MFALALTTSCGAHDKTGQDMPGAGGSSASSNGTGGDRGGSAQGTGGGSSTASGGSGGMSAGSGTGGKASSTGGANSAHAGAQGAAGGAAAMSDAGMVQSHDSGSSMNENTPEDADCDLNGVWIARLTSFSLDTVVMSVQTASNWFYYEVAQKGRDVTIRAELDCGIQVSGSADVTLTDATLKALLTRNDQTGRKGTFYKDGDHCALKIDRFYSTRGIPRDKYLPADTSSNPALKDITPALPTMAMPDGNEDWDMDGQPGIAYNASGLGTRHVVQRDWNEFFSDSSSADYQIGLNADHFIVRANFDSSEEILTTTGGLGAALLYAGSAPQHDGLHRIEWKRLGRDKSEPGVSAVRVSDGVETCHNVQKALPHDSAMK